jgi:hypothetical protein
MSETGAQKLRYVGSVFAHGKDSDDNRTSRNVSEAEQREEERRSGTADIAVSFKSSNSSDVAPSGEEQLVVA